MLRVAMIAPDYPLESGAVHGGVGAAAYYLCTALARSGQVEVHVIRPLCEHKDLGDHVVDGIPVHPLLHMRRYTKFLSLFILTPLLVRKIVRHIRPDIVHIQGYGYLSQWMPCPTVCTMHGIVERERPFMDSSLWGRIQAFVLMAMEKHTRSWMKNVIAISEYTRQFLPPPSAGRLRIWDIPNALDDSFFHIERRPIPRRILCTATITPLKNTHALIHAFARLAVRWPDSEIHFAGAVREAEYGKLCAETAERLGVANRVKMLGSLNIAQLQSELAEAWCFGLCSRQENLPMAIAEAMAAGVPVVASRVGGVPSMFREGQSGFLVDDPTNVEEIAAKLSCVLDGDRSLIMGRQARMDAERFRASRVADATIAVYREILNPQNHSFPHDCLSPG